MKIKRIESTKPLLAPRKKVAAYARVSMESEKLAHSLSAQVSYYSELIQANPDWEYAGVYADSFISGTGTANRPELQRLIADCEAGRIHIVLTKSISRFARNTVDLLKIVRRLKELGISVRFEKENIDSLTADGELMLSILAGFAEEESKSISTNIKWAVQKKFERGEQWHTAAFGYRWNGETFVIQEDEAVVVRRIFEDFLADVPIKRIQKWVNAEGWPISNVGITYMLQNEVYKGDVILQKYFTPNPLSHQSKRNAGELPRYYVEENHAPIVSKDIWQRVQDKIREAREYNPTVHRIVKPSVFSGKIICGRCGCHYTRGMTRIAKADGLQESWVCFGKIKHKKAFCDSLSLRGDRLREAAAQAMGLTEFDERAFTERVNQVFTTESEMLEFRFYDGTIKQAPIKLYSPHHMATDDPHQRFPGYEWTQQGYRIVPEEAEMVRLVYRLYAEGRTITTIRKEVEAAGFASYRGKVSHRFITRMLDDERYTGRRTLAARYSGTGKDELIEHDHEAIIDADTFAKVQTLRTISWQKQEKRLATNRAKWEAEHGEDSNRISSDD